MYYRGAAAAVVVYDITRASTFKTLKNWIDELKNKGPKDIVIVIAGNKADLDTHRVSDLLIKVLYSNQINLSIYNFISIFIFIFRRLIKTWLEVMQKKSVLCMLKPAQKMI